MFEHRNPRSSIDAEINVFSYLWKLNDHLLKSYSSAERRNCCTANILSKEMTSKHMALWMLSSCSLPWVLIGERKVEEWVIYSPRWVKSSLRKTSIAIFFSTCLPAEYEPHVINTEFIFIVRYWQDCKESCCLQPFHMKKIYHWWYWLLIIFWLYNNNKVHTL